MLVPSESALRKRLEALLEEALVAGLKTLLVASLTDAALDAAALCRRYPVLDHAVEACVSAYRALCHSLGVVSALYTGVQELGCAAHHVVRILQHGVEALRSAWLVGSGLLKALVHVGRALCHVAHCLGYLLYLLLDYSH